MDMHKYFEATTPLNIKPNDPGILTFKQYHDMRNPENKSHDSDAYVADIYTLNYQFLLPRHKTNERIRTYDNMWMIRYDQFTDNSEISIMKKVRNEHDTSDGNIVAVYYDGKWIYQPKQVKLDDLKLSEKKGRYVEHKYPERFLEMALKELAIEKNKSNNYEAFKRMKIAGEYFTFHKQKDYDAINVLNSEGIEVATASNEWGTTLIQVADEYKGKGLGAILGELFIDEYDLPSGGYTAAGYKNSMKIWSKRVGEYIQNGWYSELVKNGRMKVDDVKAIISDYKRLTNKQEKIPSISKSKATTKDYLLYTDETTFILYDKKFLEEQDEQYIYGYTFLRSTDHELDIVYTFEYDDDESRKLLSYILLQSQRNNDTGVNVHFSGSDMFEYDDLKNVEYRDGFVYLTKDVIDLDKMKSIETRIRKKIDTYNEILYQLQEMAESKYT